MQILNYTYHTSAEANFRMAAHSIASALEEGRITESDQQLIERFMLRLRSTVSPARFFKLVSILVNLRRYLRVEYAAADEVEYLTALSNIKYAKHQNGPKKGEPYTPNVITDWTKVLKRFYKFLHSENLTSVPLKVIEETRPGTYDRHCKSDEDVLTADEISALIDATRSVKIKAYIGLLYELGARSIELANLKWKDIQVRSNFASITLHDTKTRKLRVVPSIIYTKYLYEWRAQYPGEAYGDNFVFVNLYGQPFRYAMIRKIIQELAKKAGIQKRVTLHIFRHSRITHVLREGMNETLVKKAFWGNVSTGMIETYGHLTNVDVENEYLRLVGVKVEKERIESSPKPVTCPVCMRINPPGTQFCTCGKCLDEELEEEIKENVQKLEMWFEKKSDIEKFRILKKFK